MRFLLGPRDQHLLERGRELRVDYSDDGWGKGFHVSTTHAAGCATPW